ncbi:MAG: XRE family transcriptional regulator [Hamadaea sp.]|nr:XRE family transcriptional regulator [Hamadaea sp.]
MEPDSETRDPSSRDGFATLLRRHRLAAGLTQAELAAAAEIGVRTVRDLEAGRSVRPQRSTVELLGAALGLSGRDLTVFIAVARGRGRLAPADVPHAPRALPQAGELIGRDDEITALVEHLRTARGVTTLVGLAGVGKTVLALTASARLRDVLPGGAVGVMVAPDEAEAGILDSVCAVTGVSTPAELAEAFRKPALLLVDAVDRSRPAVAAALTRLLALAPQLRVIATGRAPVGLPGEQIRPVAPLALPPVDTRTLDAAQRHPASALFLARWARHRGEPPAESEVDAVVRLVRRLSGLPLAIELAAARGRLLDPSEMLARFALDGQVVSAAEAVRAAVVASYRLLTPAHRQALRYLATFTHRWSIELAEELLSTDRPREGVPAVDVVDLLDRLTDLGLVTVRGQGAVRFVVLESVREYALEQAEAAGELTAARRRHAVVFARFAARTAPMFSGPQLSAAVARLDDVSGNLWSALAHAAHDDPHTALCLASKLPRWWRFRGRDVQGRQWLRRLLDDPRCADADPKVRAWAMIGIAQLANEHGAGAEEIGQARAAVDTFGRLGDVTGELAARTVLFALCMGTGDFDEAREHSREALTLASRTGRVRDMAVAQANLTWHDIRSADLAAAQRRLTEVDRLTARSGDFRLRVLSRGNLAEVLRLSGRLEEAVVVGAQTLDLLAELGDPSHRRRVLTTVALAQAETGEVAEAERILTDLRASLPATASDDGAGHVEEDGACAVVEAAIAFRRGQLSLAASWYAAAADAYAGGHDLRDVVQALVGLVCATDDPPERAQALERLDALLTASGIALTDRESAALGR